MRLAFGFALVFSVWNSSFAAQVLGDEITLADFTKQVQGDYEIKKADGQDTHYPDGSVADETDEVVLTFPYCPPGGSLCDPGYIFLPKQPVGTVKVFKKEIPTKADLYTLVHKDGADETIYEWQEPLVKGELLQFRRFNYVYGTNAPITLEFLFLKKPPQNPAPSP